MQTRLNKALLTIAAFLALAVAVVVFNFVYYYMFAGAVEIVSFRSGDVQLSGRLIKPHDSASYPAVVFLHGSGPESNDDPAYRVNANALVRKGFAVLLYDKRGVGDSGGDFDSARFSDFVDDGIAAVNYLAGRDDIKGDKIGLFGTSEGGWFTPEIAARSGSVAFIFNRVGPPFSWIQNVIWEVRNDFIADGIGEQDVDPLLDITRQRWEFYIAVGNNPLNDDAVERARIDAEIQRLRETVANADLVLPEQLRPYDEEWYSAFSADAEYDPRPFLEAINIPMLYVYGQNDVNIPTEEAVAYLQQFREEHDKNIEILVYPDVGHSMATWKGLFSATYTPGYLQHMGTWSAAQVSD